MTLPRREKVILFTLMALGLFCCAATVSRIVAQHSPRTQMDPTAGLYDFWVCMELNIGIIAVSLPSLRGKLEPYLMRLANFLTTGLGLSSSGSASKKDDVAQHANGGFNTKPTFQYEGSYSADGIAEELKSRECVENRNDSWVDLEAIGKTKE